MIIVRKTIRFELAMNSANCQEKLIKLAKKGNDEPDFG